MENRKPPSLKKLFDDEIKEIDNEIEKLKKLKYQGFWRLKVPLWISYGRHGITITRSIRRGIRVLKQMKKHMIRMENTEHI